MKPGDKIYCVKKHIIHDTVVLYKNKTYTIVNFGEDINFSNIPYKYVNTTSENGNKNWNLDNKGHYYKFSDFFMSDQEIRKQKLLKIQKTI